MYLLITKLSECMILYEIRKEYLMAARQLKFRTDLRLARRLWPGQVLKIQTQILQTLAGRFLLSVAAGDLLLLHGRWYVTNSGLLRLADRRHCSGIRVQPVRECLSSKEATEAI